MAFSSNLVALNLTSGCGDFVFSLNISSKVLLSSGVFIARSMIPFKSFSDSSSATIEVLALLWLHIFKKPGLKVEISLSE